MLKKHLVLLLLFITQIPAAFSQQYGLFNTKTLFDAFENPAQAAFSTDSSRKFASNFLLPNFGINAAYKGKGGDVIYKLLHNGEFDTSLLKEGMLSKNEVLLSYNQYLLNFRIFHSKTAQQELGFSWQLRSQTNVNYTNESLILFDDYNRLNTDQDGIFDGNGQSQTWHQFSFNYRRNLSERLSIGAKVSLLSGITFNRISIDRSILNLDKEKQQLEVGLEGEYRGNFIRTKELKFNTLLPDFSSPGASVSLGTSYSSPSGFFMMANLKDLGFIRWNKSSKILSVNQRLTVGTATSTDKETLEKELDELGYTAKEKSFMSATPAYADLMISQRINFYTPGLILSKSLTDQGGDIAFVNKLEYQGFSVSVIPAYAWIGMFRLGAQAMYKTPDFEFYLGSDHLTGTIALSQRNYNGRNTQGAAFYLGMGIKFGKKM